MTMEKEVSQALETALSTQYITRGECLGTGQSAENNRQVPVETGEASGAIPHRATTRPRRGSTQQQKTQPVETVNQLNQLMCQYYIITKLETIKIGYRQEIHDKFTRQYPEMDISEQRIADQ
jgi:hypothetical protein